MNLNVLIAVAGMAIFGLVVHELFPPDLYLAKSTQYGVMAFCIAFGAWLAFADEF